MNNDEKELQRKENRLNRLFDTIELLDWRGRDSYKKMEVVIELLKDLDHPNVANMLRNDMDNLMESLNSVSSLMYIIKGDE